VAEKGTLLSQFDNELVSNDRSLSIPTSSTKLLRRNPLRVWAEFVNDGAGDIYVAQGKAATVITGRKIVPNGVFRIDKFTPWDGEVYAIATATSLFVGEEVEVKN
jgi:hypothetical protein